MPPREFKIPWMDTAKMLLDIQEYPGYESNTIILNWAKIVGNEHPFVKSYYKSDDIPWCGLFTAYCMISNDISLHIDNPLRALEWKQFGIECDPVYASTLVFTRTGGGHVAFYISEDEQSYHVLGGNQADSVNVTKIAKSRLVSARWPNDYSFLLQYQQPKIRKFNGKWSYNEI